MTYSALELANAFIKAGELDDALDALNDHLDSQPDSFDEKRLRIEILMRLDGDENLLTALNALASLHDKTAEDYILQSVVLERLSRPEELLDVLMTGYQKFPERERLIERYVYVLQSQSKFSEAKSVIENVLEFHPQSWRWLQWAGDICTELGDYETALKYYDMAIDVIRSTFTDISGSITGIYARLLLARADVLAKLNLVERADHDYLEAEKLIPDDPMIPFRRGILYVERDTDKAVELCHQAYDAASPFFREEMTKILKNYPQLPQP